LDPSFLAVYTNPIPAHEARSHVCERCTHECVRHDSIFSAPMTWAINSLPMEFPDYRRRLPLGRQWQDGQSRAGIREWSRWLLGWAIQRGQRCATPKHRYTTMVVAANSTPAVCRNHSISWCAVPRVGVLWN